MDGISLLDVDGISLVDGTSLDVAGICLDVDSISLDVDGRFMPVGSRFILPDVDDRFMLRGVQDKSSYDAIWKFGGVVGEVLLLL